MENKSEIIKELQQRILMLEKENTELKNDISSDGFSVIDVLGIDDTTSQKHDVHHDMPESDIAFNEPLYAEYCLTRIDDSIKECENMINLTNEHDEYKLICSSNELKKGFNFQLKRENDKLHVIDAQIKDINKYFSTAPSGNTVLTHTVVNENAYDQLIYKREMINHSINKIRVKIHGLDVNVLVNDSDGHYRGNSEGMGCRQFNIFESFNNKIKGYENRIESLLKEKQCIIHELKSNKLIDRVTAEIEQIHIEIAKKERMISGKYSLVHCEIAGMSGRPGRNTYLEILDGFPVSAKQLLQYLHFVPKQWFKDKFLARKIFYENTYSMSDDDVRMFLSQPNSTFNVRSQYPADADNKLRYYRNLCKIMSDKYAKCICVIDEFKTNVPY